MNFFKKKRLEQANQISAWIVQEDEDGFACVAVLNSSNFSISKVILSTVDTRNKASSGLKTPGGYRAYLSIVPPGKFYTRIRIQHGMGFLSGIEISFKDINDESWIRNGDGILKKINQPPYEYYGLTLPLPWEQPKEKII